LLRDNDIGDIAAFNHGLEKTDFDEFGRPLTDKRVFFVEVCLFAGSSDSGVFTASLGEGKNVIMVQSSCVGRPKRFPNLDIDFHEIGTSLVPFYIIFAHELLHVEHFLSSLYCRLYTKVETTGIFLGYGKAIAIESFNDVIKFVFGGKIQQEMSGEDLRKAVETSLGTLPGMEEYFDFYQRCKERRKGLELPWITVMRGLPWPNLEELRTVFGSPASTV
jgi:hypothetical protein